jgi:hypothetical protein
VRGDRLADDQLSRVFQRLPDLLSGISPTPVRPALSLRMTMLRVNSGPCAPLKLSSIESSPATGMICIPVTVGDPRAASAMSD